MCRSTLLALVACFALRAAALEGEAASHLQRLLGDPATVPQAGSSTEIPIRNVGQTVWALSLSGELVVARGLVELGLGAVKDSERAGRPAGSLPPTLRADGTTRDPRYLVDAQAVAALLEATSHYVSALPEDGRREWLDKWWDAISLAGNFVIGWTRGPRGAPFPAYDPRFGRDVGGVRESMGALLAVLCAQGLAQLGDKPVPETWRQRREALEALVRTTDFSDNGRADVILPWGIRDLRGILPLEHPLWTAQIGGTSLREHAWQSAPQNEPAQALIGLLARPAETP